MNPFPRIAFGVLFVMCYFASTAGADSQKPLRPNIIYVFCDNLGYGDIEPFGSERHRTPNLNRMAREGRKFTHYYSASGVCTPSRAALMTGCYPQRVSMSVTDGVVLRPVSEIGLHPDEVTIAEALKGAGYATGAFGKWHLGDQPEFLPTRQGFDDYLGIPYSDDMTPRPGRNWPPLPLMKNEEVIEAPVDRDLLTKRLSNAAVHWIEEHRNQPFFLYLPECMPGSTRAPFASPAFKGKSKNGPWGDAIEELDWSLGEVLKAVERLGIDDRTLVIWTSDNGAPRRKPPQGLNLPLGGWGYSTAEGGMRVPCIMRWPGKIPPDSVCSELTTTMDMLPTFAHLAGAKLSDRKIDGKNVWSLMADEPAAKTPHEAFYYYHLDQLQAVRSGPWKLHLAIAAPATGDNRESAARTASLYNVAKDPGEKRDVLTSHPMIAKRLEDLATKGIAELGNRGKRGAGQRPAGRNRQPKPLRFKGR